MVAPLDTKKLSYHDWVRREFVSDPTATIEENKKRASKEYVDYLSYVDRDLERCL